MPVACIEHNQVTRVAVVYTYWLYDRTFKSKSIVDLLCRCRVLDQLKTNFLESCKMFKHSPNDVVFSCATPDGPSIAIDGYDIYNSIIPELSRDYGRYPQLLLQVQFSSAPATKLEGLEKAVNEVKKTIKSDKHWRVLKDTEIAEEHLTLREMFEKQQKEIKTLQTEMAEMKNQNRKNEKERRSAFLERHEAICDKCADLIVGHRFKCAICFNFDLCQRCESQGIHQHHVMLRIVSPEHTQVPIHLLPKKEDRIEKYEAPTDYFIHYQNDKYWEEPFPKMSDPHVSEQQNSIKKSIKIDEIRNKPTSIVSLKDEIQQENKSDLEKNEPSKGITDAGFREEIRKIYNSFLIKQAKEDDKKMEKVKNQTKAGQNTPINIDDSDSDETKSVSSDSSDSSDSSQSSDSSALFNSSRGSISPALSFETLSDILRELEEHDGLSERFKRHSSEEFDKIEDKEEELHTAVLPSPETYD
uniref:ZZ-type domain-containing protein n=1 Tax=Caenorhabditis tropicalis TaxID=1561998 RepID=A0A1I7V059_9PELO